MIPIHRTMTFPLIRLAPAFLTLTLVAPGLGDDRVGSDVFETRIRPVLVERCYGCHSSAGEREGGLAVDSRDALRRGGRSGPALVPGDAEASLLIRALRQEPGAPRMPKDGPKLAAGVVADFERWVDSGAADPRDAPPSRSELDAVTSWEAVRDRRLRWWSFRPLDATAPGDGLPEWSDQLIDRFIAARLKDAGLQPAARAERATLARRVTFALTGLPPSPEEIAAFERDAESSGEETAWARLVDLLLDAPAFGERWARHWMDWLRYAESHGSEGDPAIPHAWRYRDAIIRALNDDVPYDRLVREHIAGDLLPDPRIDEESRISESALATGHYRMVQHGYAPVDPLDEQVRFVENQIDVISKAFLGLTVACARCHDHKFDPISQRDFYALYGIMASSRPALITVDEARRSASAAKELAALKREIKRELARAWTEVLASTEPERERTREHGARRRVESPPAFPRQRWDLRSPADYAAWHCHGRGLPEAPSPAGEFHVLSGGERVVSAVYPAGVYTHRLSTKQNGVLTSPRFKVECDEIGVRVLGGGNARLRLVVQNYPRAQGPIYSSYRPNREAMGWHFFNTEYWKGDHAYIEFATASDVPVEARGERERSWFGIAEVVLLPRGEERPRSPENDALGVLERAWKAASSDEARERVRREHAGILRECVGAWKADDLDDRRSELLSFCVREGVLPNTLESLPRVAPLVERYRRIESDLPFPTRAPGVLEADGFDQPLMVRGNHRVEGEPVPRGFLEAFGGRTYKTPRSGRLELARDLTDPSNPLVARVIVNRVWHHLFGLGIVPTTDNFGRLGERPSHPRLLDALAARVVADGWSLKRLVRLLVTSETYRLSSTPSDRAREVDPANALLSHFRVRRLEAEAIRDAILAVSGTLNRDMFGPGVGGREPRRSVYVNVRRNSLDPLLQAFDAPQPFTTVGRRPATNVPAQSLALLNDRFVIDRARDWARAVLEDASLKTDAGRIERMYRVAFGRPPSEAETVRCESFVGDASERRARLAREVERLERETRSHRERVAALLDTGRAAVLSRRQQTPESASSLPEPFAAWEFDGDYRDLVGELHGVPRGVRLEDGAAVFNGDAWIETPPLPARLREKTLEVSVQLDTLDQRGAGVMGVQTPGGAVFDSVVFGEQEPRRWLPGSDFFRRTESVGGEVESEAHSRPVHVAIAFDGDGTIRAYRDGKSYGSPYRSNGPVTFESGSSQVIFGMRHAPAGGDRMLRGRIHRARLYDRALSAEEVAAAASGDRDFVPRGEILAALPEARRAELEKLGARIETLEAELRELRLPEGADRPERAWESLAHALFNFKEFIYVR